VLEATDAILGNGAGRGSTITASTLGGTAPLQPGQTVTLIDNVTPGGLASTQATGKHGATLRYNWTLDDSAGLVANLNSVQVAPETKALLEGYLGGAILINQTADRIGGKALWQAVNAAKDTGFGAFFDFSGGWSKYDSGSHVDMASLSVIAGLSRGADLTPGRLTLGAFFEFGTGSYDTYNSFNSAASKNKGDVRHLGGGILGRFDATCGGYAETSLRIGGVSNEFKGRDLTDGAGGSASYDSDALYLGAHLGAGYVWKITDQASLDFYGKYFWTRVNSDSVTLDTGDPIKFKAVNSHRLRGGARFAYVMNEFVTPYAGLAYEHELDGKARGATYGYSIDAPSLRGGTGIGELGLALKPSSALPLSFDLGVQGYVGQREGVTGSLQVKWEF
jgi:outer membrane autotransporter protein